MLWVPGRRTMKLFYVAIAVLVLLPCVALADKVILKDGGEVIGKVVVTETEVEVTVREGMKVSIPKDQVKEIIFEKTPVEEFEERLAKIDAEDAAGFYELGLWAREQGLKEEARRTFEKVIKLAPDHAGARKELGYIRHEGEWVLYEEAMKDKGLVRYKGRWVTPEKKKELEEEAAAAKLQKRVRWLITLLASESQDKVAKAAEEYSKIDSPHALPALKKGARHRKAFIRMLTIHVYGNFDSELVTKPLIGRALHDGDKEVRAEAVKVLLEIKSQTAYITLLDNFFYSKDGDVRVRAMDALGGLKDKNSVEPLIEAVSFTIKRVASVPVGAPNTYIGTQSRRVVGYSHLIDSHGRTVSVPVLGGLSTGIGPGRSGEVVDDVIFNLGARLALREMTGHDFNYEKQEWREWFAENKDKFGPYMEPKEDKKEEAKEEKEEKKGKEK